MTIYVHKRFDKSFKKMVLSDQILLEAAEQVIRDEFEANLGGDVIKKRISLQEGKRGGARKSFSSDLIITSFSMMAGLKVA